MIYLGAAPTFFVRLIYSYFKGKSIDLPGQVSDAAMVGVMALGGVSIYLAGNLTAVPGIIAAYTPHAYNLIFWPVMVFLVIRPRFGARWMLPVLAMVYGLDELVWNSFVFLRFAWVPDAFQLTPTHGVLFFMATQYWQIFILVMGLAFLFGALLVQPKFRLSIGLPVMLGFGFFWAFIAGFPAGALTPISLAWEFMWQGAWWFFVYTSFFKNENRKPFELSPLV